MTKKKIVFGGGTTTFYFDGAIAQLSELQANRQMVVVTDENVFAAHQRKFKWFDTIVVPAGESFKSQTTVDLVIEQLIAHGADRNTLLVGIGGGVVTDITGYVASIYMRGLSFGFVPTTVLAMVDAAIGGKNGIDVGLYKNIVGTIRQPEFLLYDYSLLKTLPQEEWVNGFAEVIKHAAIKDAPLLKQLQQQTIRGYQRRKDLLHALIMRNAMIKIKVVQGDEFEKGERKLLNFGHTLGHAIENMLALPHGHAISVGMVYAAHLSTRLNGFRHSIALIDLLEQYELPTHASFDIDKAITNLAMDKKRTGQTMHFVLLSRLGKAEVKPIPMEELGEYLNELSGTA